MVIAPDAISPNTIEWLPAQKEEPNVSEASIPMPIPGQFVALSSITLAPPSEFALGALHDGRLRVVEPIAVNWTKEDGQCVAEAHEISEFGFGGNLTEAIADLQAAIAELYFTLEAEQERLGPDLQAVRATLTRKIRRADVPVGA